MTARRLLAAIAALLFAQAAWSAGLTIGGYVLQSSRRVSPTQTEQVYRATVTNNGPAMSKVAATALSMSPATQLLKGTLQFGDVPASASVLSLDSFTVRQSLAQPFDASKLRWTVSGTPALPFRADFSYAPTTASAPADIRFVPAQIAAAVVEKFEWDFNGDGIVDITDTVGRNQSRRYTVPGSYTVSLKITDALGRSDTRVRTIVIGNDPPVVTASASPSNGAAPLAVNFSASATDYEGVDHWDWDFDGDGIYDRTLTSFSGNTSWAYASAGSYAPRLRVTDLRGASTVVSLPTMAIRAGPPGTPQVTLTATTTNGNAPLATRLTATVSLVGVQRYEWDANGDGSYEASTTLSSYDTTYTSAGNFYPRVRVTMGNGAVSEDALLVTVRSTVGLSVSTDTLDTQVGPSVDVVSTLSAPTRVSVIVERRGGGTVRTLVPPTLRAAGSHSDAWNGRGDNGQPVGEGIYHAVLLHETNGVMQRLDLSTSTGGSEFNPPRTSLPTSFMPFDGSPLAVDFTLDNAAEVTAFIGSYNVNSRYTTFFTRQGFGRGTHRINWSGENTEGQLVKPAPGDSFLFGIFGYRLPDNAIFVRNSAQVSAITSAPAIFDPTGITAAGTPGSNTIRFTLSAPASVELMVQDTLTGVVVNRIVHAGLAAGANTLAWDGKARDGRYVAPGTYRLGVTPIQANGFRALTGYVLQRVYF